MKTSLSSAVVQALRLNSSKNIIGKKIDNKWVWRDKNYILNSISYCQDYLKSENIQRGDRVAYKGENSVEWLSWNIACNSLGGIWVPMYNDQSENYCKHVLEDSEAKVLITNSYNNNNNGIKQLSSEIEDYEPVKELQHEYNEVSNLIYTSGTTGKPKGVMLSNENILSNVYDTRSRFNTMPEITCLNILPWAHVYSQSCELYYNVLFNNKIAISTSRFSFLKELKEIKPDVLYLVPRVLELIKSKTEFLDVSLLNTLLPILLKRVFGKNLKTIYVGGAKLQDSTKIFFKKAGYTLCEGYGCTELSPMVSVNHMDNPRNEKSIGKILDSVLVEIIEDEIQVSGPNVMLGYWNNEEATKKVLVKRGDRTWYKTGDGGYIEDGFLFYTGRNSYNYKLSNGKFVNVEYVESIVKKHVKCNCVVFTKDNIHNEIITNIQFNEDFLEVINKDLNKYLKIHKAHWVHEEHWEKYLTPKMSIKRKDLIQDFNDGKIRKIVVK